MAKYLVTLKIFFLANVCQKYQILFQVGLFSYQWLPIRLKLINQMCHKSMSKHLIWQFYSSLTGSS